MTIVLNGTTGITNDGGYTGDGVSFADTTPSNTLVTTTGGNVGIGTSSPAYKLQVNGGTATRISADTTSGTYYNRLVASQTFAYSGIEYSTLFNFVDGATERMRIDSSGNLLVNATSTTGNLEKMTLLYPANSNNGIFIKNTFAGTGVNIGFVNSSNTTVGNIQSSTTVTSYVTTSDYRLKDNIAPMTGALATVQSLKPVTYTWKADGSDGQGFIAHELQAVVPDAATGEKDAVDAEGNPVYQGIDASFLVATLTAAIQELKAELDSVKAELATLKA
jgi:hypothetical protein